MLGTDRIKLNQAIGVYLKDLMGCNVRFRYIVHTSKSVAVEILYPVKYKGIRIGIPLSLIQNAEHSTLWGGGVL